MIYFDNAATSFPKPHAVLQASAKCMKSYCGNPGRSSHKLSLAAAEKIYDCRVELSELFGSPLPERVVFTYNTTYALNMAIKSTVQTGDHILISELEHNSVLRPIASLHSRGIADYDIFHVVGKTDDEIIDDIRSRLRSNTRLLVCTHASNICAIKLPIDRIGALCKKLGVIFIVDAAQSAGIYDINMEKMNIDILCAPGHKSLYGPQGTGFAIFSERLSPNTFIEGGNGISSKEKGMPDELPEHFEAGTLATPAIAGLYEGIRYVRSMGLETIRQKEVSLGARFVEMLSSINGITIYARDLIGSTVLFNVNEISSERICAGLDRQGICLRGGFHCSPLAHSALGTGENGAVRASFGIFNTFDEIELFYKRLKETVFTA